MLVNMNAADDKENNSSSRSKLRVMNVSDVTTDSSDGDKNETNSQVKFNGSSHQNNDGNDRIAAISVCNRTNSSSGDVYDNNLPSTSSKLNCSPNCNKWEKNQTKPSNRETEDQTNVKKCHAESDNQLTSKPIQYQCYAKSQDVSNYDVNSSSEDEECCIYTYKGDSNQMADLPNSFLRLDSTLQRHNNHSGNSSPDMDYLEMDFDPGPSNDKDSSSSSDFGEEIRDEGCTPEALLSPGQDDEAALDPEVDEDVNFHSSNSPRITPFHATPKMTEPPSQHCSSNDVLQSPSSSPQRSSAYPDIENYVAQAYCTCVSNTFSTSIDENFNDGEEATMFMKDREEEEKQMNLIGPSASGATAVINTLIALNVPFTIDSVTRLVGTRLRDEKAPLPEYLMSRANAGSTHEDLIRGLQEESANLVYARFFPMFPQRSVALSSWLSYWIKKGAVPILTLNTQRTPGNSTDISDAWQHRTVYGVSLRGVRLTNILETVAEATLRPQLASPPILLVRREDILSRYTPTTSLHPLTDPTLPDWRRLNVLGQVAHVIRESMRNLSTTSHVKIPASWSSGVTLAILRSESAYEELRSAPELPVDPFATS